MADLTPLSFEVDFGLEIITGPLFDGMVVRQTAVRGEERLDASCYAKRAKVPGGWLVLISDMGCVGGATFYSDPDHGWDGNSFP